MYSLHFFFFLYSQTFDVKSIPNPINIAYSNVSLGFHMDLMYYESPPGLQLLHCLRLGCWLHYKVKFCE